MRIKTVLRIIPAYKGVMKYANELRKSPGVDAATAWLKHVVNPYMDKLTDGQLDVEKLHYKFSGPPLDIDKLDRVARIVAASGAEFKIEQAFADICSLIQKTNETVVYIYPLDPANTLAREKQHGVVCTGTGDNILLEIDPTVRDWNEWMAYVIAHEYHHSVWNYNYFQAKGNKTVDLLTKLIIDGQADSFAMKLSPWLEPSWLCALTPKQESEQWALMKGLLDSTDSAIHTRFFSGDAKTITPQFTANTIGYHIVQSYLKVHQGMKFDVLLDKEPREILKESGYSGRY